jgi:hypothetical protein
MDRCRGAPENLCAPRVRQQRTAHPPFWRCAAVAPARRPQPRRKRSARERCEMRVPPSNARRPVPDSAEQQDSAAAEKERESASVAAHQSSGCGGRHLRPARCQRFACTACIHTQPLPSRCMRVQMRQPASRAARPSGASARRTASEVESSRCGCAACGVRCSAVRSAAVGCRARRCAGSAHGSRAPPSPSARAIALRTAHAPASQIHCTLPHRTLPSRHHTFRTVAAQPTLHPSR